MLNQEEGNGNNFVTIALIRMFQIIWVNFLTNNKLTFIFFKLLLLEHIGV